MIFKLLRDDLVLKHNNSTNIQVKQKNLRSDKNNSNKRVVQWLLPSSAQLKAPDMESHYSQKTVKEIENLNKHIGNMSATIWETICSVNQCMMATI